MMKGRFFLLAVSSVLAILLACDTEFNPKGEFLDRVVVWGTLSTQRSEHVVRISTTYDPPGFNPLEYTQSNEISGAVVTIEVNATTTVLRDTTVPRDETNRYQDSIRAYVYAPGTISRGAVYTLTAAVPGYGTVTATTTPPGSGMIEIDSNNRLILTNPDVNRRDAFIFATPANNAEGHAVRVFLEYEVVTLSPGVFMKEEVPVTTSNYQDCLTYDRAYPSIRRRQNIGREPWVMPYTSYRRTILKILKAYEGHVVSFRRAILTLTQADKHLYRYYSLVGGFRDEFSIRVDEPNYTNIQGGLGVFGSFTTDSLFVNLPADFPKIQCS